MRLRPVSREERLRGRREPASEARDAGASAITAASAPAIAFVWTQARQALQQTAAIGACSPYLAVACATRPCQTVFMPPSYDLRRDPARGPSSGSPLEGFGRTRLAGHPTRTTRELVTHVAAPDSWTTTLSHDRAAGEGVASAGRPTNQIVATARPTKSMSRGTRLLRRVWALTSETAIGRP